MTKTFATILILLISTLIYGQTEIIITQSVCDPYNTDPFKLKERIIQNELKNDTLIIVLGKRENCCAKFIATYELRNDTLRLNYINIGDQCFCTCFYELTFNIYKQETDSLTILFNEQQYKHTDQKYSEYETKIDTLKNGNIRISKYEDNNLIFEIEDQDSIKLYRQYYMGILQSENKLINKSW